MIRNILQQQSVRTQWVIFITFIVIIMLLFNFWYSNKLIDTLEQELLNNADISVRHHEDNLSTKYDNVSAMLEAIASSELIQNYIIASSDDSRLEIQGNLKESLKLILESRVDIIDIVILGDSGDEIYINGTDSINMSLLDGLTNESSLIFSTISEDILYIGLRFNLMDTSDESNSIKVIAAKIKVEEFFGLSQEDNYIDDGELFFLDSSEHLIYASSSFNDDQKLIDEFSGYIENGMNTSFISIDNKRYYISAYKADRISGHYISVIPEDILFQKVKHLQVIQHLVSLVIFVLMLIQYRFFLSNFLSPLRRITLLMESISAGNRKMMKQRLSAKGGNIEVNILTESFNHMMDEIAALTQNLSKSYESLYEMKLETERSELAFLRSQINPHFLYNTLESIKGIAVEEDVPRITEIVNALGNMFRYSIKGENMVPLRNEINIIKSYVKIQKVRFEDRFEVEYAFDEEIMDWLLPKMVLQPLVENAIYHGLEKIESSGNLNIGGRAEDSSHMVLWVKDDGYGISKDRLNAIRESLNQKSGSYGFSSIEDSRESIGLSNVHNRIRIMYGDDYGIFINSEEGQGTQVKIRIPASQGEKNV